MLRSLLRNNFRAQLIVPTTLALLTMIVGAVVFTVIMQNNSNEVLNQQVKQSFNDITKTIDNDMHELSQNLEDKLKCI